MLARDQVSYINAWRKTDHSCLGTSLLGLEEDGLVVPARWARFVRTRELEADKKNCQVSQQKSRARKFEK
jgi:hypothetical protein